ncbi:MAG: hypothetical protein ETSY1_00235 [Candidatus Entotheonella factor]|uniref:Uncharacterized protein n=2 Tax=Candidatus Entotheonella TaxID=93171 RepID=W4M143_ENTF1|nr:MAG: hypothetical protein ETSY1_00235 [Candidatus Entotheonella factor]
MISSAMHTVNQARPALDAKVWLADLTHTQQVVSSDVIPAAVGGIATFAESRIDLPAPIRLFKYPERLAEALEHELPDVIGFSNYCWNFRLSYKFADAIRALSPRTVIIFGGPNYSVLDTERIEFLRRSPVIDFYVIKEAEVAFANLLEVLASHRLDPEAIKAGPDMPSIHWLRPDGTAALPTELPRIADLTQIPSPYLSGHLDEFFDGRLMPLLQTNRGCPFSCTFCVEGLSYYTKVYRSNAEKVQAEIDYIGRKMASVRATGDRNDLYIADSNFGMFKEDLDTCRGIANAMDRHGWPEVINVSTGKNQKERILDAGKLVRGAMRVSGTVQSLDKDVLKKIKRSNISEEQILDLALRASEIGAKSYSEIILALPGDTKEAHFQSLRTVIDAGVDFVRTWQLMILTGSELGLERARGDHQLVTKFRVLPRCYGQFTVRGQPVSASEIEEVCVAHDTMSFDDYIACRRLHLMIAIFYNDSVLTAAAKLLKMLGVSPFRWLERMAETPAHNRLREVFESFDQHTRDELWDDFDALAEFADRPETVRRYVEGEIGTNVLFMHKTMAITNYSAELAEFAGDVLCGVLEEAGKRSPETDEFVADIVTHLTHRIRNVFFERDAPVHAHLKYDIPAFETAEQPTSLAEFAHGEPIEYRFVLDAIQEEFLASRLKLYRNKLADSRIMTRHYTVKFFRHAVRADAPVQLEGQRATRFEVAGLEESIG